MFTIFVGFYTTARKTAVKIPSSSYAFRALLQQSRSVLSFHFNLRTNQTCFTQHDLLKVLKNVKVSKMEDQLENNLVLSEPPELTDEMKEILTKQNSRIVTEFNANKLEAHAARNWDLFYKRNETKFFKDR